MANKTKPYEPLSSDGLYNFTGKFCDQCEHDRVWQEQDKVEGQCALYNSFLMAINKIVENYPKEIICDLDDKNARCLEFQPYKEKEQEHPKEQPYIDDKTLDLFKDNNEVV